MTLINELNRTALEVLDTHAKNLETEFTTFEDFQDLFIDVFGNNLDSSNNLANLQNQFADGTLRPDVKFVPSEALTDAQGIARGAAFDQQSQTILLSEDLDAAGIESSIEQEIGHWWDVQLNGTKDTTTPDGQPFDEGTAYAERFSEGANGDNIFSDLVYQNDFYTILVNGQETDVEFRNIATWNIQRNSFGGDNNTLAEVINIMENPGQGQDPIEIMALQEVTFANLENRLRNIPGIENFNGGEIQTFEQTVDDGQRSFTGNVNLFEYNFERNGINYRVYYNNNSPDLSGIGNAIVLRNPPQEATPIARLNPNPAAAERGDRGYLGVETPEGTYFSIHAEAGFGLNRGNNAERLLGDIRNIQGLDENLPVFILGDFNRNIADLDSPDNEDRPSGNIDEAFARFAIPEQFIPVNDFTFSAREQNPSTTLDYMFTSAQLDDDERGIVLNQLPNARTPAFPSDHFPVLYDDGLTSINGATATLRRFIGNLQNPVGEPVTANIVRGETEFNGLDGDLSESAGEPLPAVPEPITPVFDIDLFSGDPDEGDRFSFVGDSSFGTVPSGEFSGFELSLENVPPIESVKLDDSTNSLGVADNDIELVDPNTIRVNLEGLSTGPVRFPPSRDGFDLLVDFDTGGFGF